MNHYKHLTLKEREFIMISHHDGIPITEIAKRLGKDRSTIYREIKRNTLNDNYSAIEADSLYKKRREACKPHRKLDDPELYSLVQTRIFDHQWSPEEIANRLKLEGSKYSISYATIYRAIHQGAFDVARKKAIRRLRHKGKRRHGKDYQERRGKFEISHLIDERPKEANNRERIGHWEADTVLGVTGKACLITLVDRKSRYLIAEKLSKKTAAEVNRAMERIFSRQPCLTVTPDRGKEFAKYKEVTEILDVEFYFPLPHQPWQRGSNENTNGLIREYLPKHKDMTDIPDEYIQAIVTELNTRPRKCLGYKTPYEVYYGEDLHLV